MMARFNARELDVLVATTVIEVGVDVPNATVMIVQEADRFGLAQLHQLRGRVGRGAEQSYCLLVSRAKEELTETAQRRLEALVATTDGFELAEVDLELRGGGELLGTRQHGSATSVSRGSGRPAAARARADGRQELARRPELVAPPTALRRGGPLRALLTYHLRGQADFLSPRQRRRFAGRSAGRARHRGHRATSSRSTSSPASSGSGSGHVRGRAASNGLATRGRRAHRGRGGQHRARSSPSASARGFVEPR